MNPPRFLFRLRPTLIVAIVGLVLTTSLAIGVSAGILIISETRALIEEARAGAARSASEETRQLFSVPVRLNGEMSDMAHREGVALDVSKRLAAQFTERLRAFPVLSALGYGDVAGWYVGAVRNSTGAIIEYLVDPAVNGGIPQRKVVSTSGDGSPLIEAETKPYSVLTRPWFVKGLASGGPSWSEFYTFVDGGTGVTAMIPYVEPGAAAPRGVFHTDLRVEAMAHFLSTLRVGKHGAVFLVRADGQRAVGPDAADSDAAKAIDAASRHMATADLSHPVQVRVGARLYEVVFEPVTAEGNIALSIGVVVDLADVSHGAYRHAATAAAVGLFTVLLAVLLGRALSSRIAHPIVAIADDLARVGSFDISHEPTPRSFVREVDALGVSAERMKASLRSFAHYVPTDLVRRLLVEGEEAQLGVETRRLTMFFSDVRDFTTISETTDPDRLIELMGRYLELMTGAITRHGGTVDKFIGDGVMAFFNAPEELPDHPRQGCLAALEAQRLLAQAAVVAAPGEPIFRTRIGLGVGNALVGNIGTPERFAYTLLGDEVNLASRLESLNKTYGTWIMCSEAVVSEAGDGFEWRRLDRVAVKGRSKGTLVYELLGLAGEVDAASLAFRDRYEAALDVYFAGEFEQAAELFEGVERMRHDDPGASMMRDRCYLLASNPPADWDGIHVMHEK